MHVASPNASGDELRSGFEPVARRLDTDWAMFNLAKKMRVLIAVSKSAHCLNDLFFKWQNGTLPIEIAGIVSNHPDLAPLAQMARRSIPSFADLKGDEGPS